MKQIYLTALFLLLGTVGFSQQVSNINAGVSGEKIRITYTISGLKYYQDITGIDVYVSKDNGENYTGPLKQVTGDVKGNLRNGRHTIVWDVLKEMPFSDEQLVFDVRLTVVDKPRKKHLFVTITGNDVTPLGLRVGMLGKTGFYIEARASLLAGETPAYTYNGKTIEDYNKPGYYIFNGKGGWQAYSAVAGITQQVSWNTFLYAGAGYGVENYITQIDQFDYETDQTTGTAWAKDKEYSNNGVEVDAGIILKFNHFVISAGGTALNFKSFGWTAGIGVAF